MIHCVCSKCLPRQWGTLAKNCEGLFEYALERVTVPIIRSSSTRGVLITSQKTFEVNGELKVPLISLGPFNFVKARGVV